jgi:PAS domain S-box-containing protein
LNVTCSNGGVSLLADVEMEKLRDRSTLHRYLAALIAPVVVAGVMQLTWPFFKESPAAIYLVAIALSSWYGGLRSGLVSTIVSFLLIDYFFLPPYFSLEHSSRLEIIRMIVLIAVGIFISVLNGLLRKEKARAEKSLRVLRASEERYRKLADNFPNGAVSTYNKDLRMTFIAGKGLEKNNLSADFFIGKSLKEIAPPEIVAIVEPQFRAAFAGEVVSYECPYPDGPTYLVSVAPLFEGEQINEILVIAQNVTEHKAIENKLKQSESQLAEAQRLANVGSWNWDLKSNERTWSDELYRIFGLPRNRPVPDLDATLQEYIHPDDRDILKSSIERLLVDKESCSFSYRIIRPDGAERSIHSRGNVATDSSGNVIRMYGTAQDVTEREHTEKARRDAEQKYRDIFENAGEGIFQSTPEGQYISANPALARIHGFDSPEELISSRKDITREVYVDPARRLEFKRLLEEQGLVRGFEHEIFRQDGSRIWCSLNARAVYDEGGIVQYYEGTAQDITERKSTEAALRESEELFSKAFHSSPAPLIMTRLSDGCFLNANDAFLRAFEYERAEVIGQTVGSLNIYVNPGDRNRLISELQDLGTLRQYESKARTKSGRILDLIVFVEPATLNGEQCLLSTAYDVTDRKRFEAALRESEERYRDLVEHSHELICTHDLDGLVLSANRAATDALGYDHDQVVGKKSIRDILAPEVRHQFDEYMAKLRSEGATKGIMLVETSSGERRVWEYYNSLRTEGVATPIVRGMARDITEQRRAKEALQLFRNLIDQSNDAIEVIDPITYRFLDCNESAYRSLGYTREEFLSLTIFDIDPLVDSGSIARQEMEMKESGFATLESLHLRKDGTTFPVEVNVKLVRLERDYRLAVVRDITSRKRAEEALRASEERYRELFENAKDALYVHDLSGRYVSLNRAAEELTGFSRDEIIGKHFSNFVVPRDLKHVRRNLCTKLDEERETSYEIELLTKDRRRVPVEVVSRLIYENGEPIGVQGTARDITERRRAQEALQMYSRRLIEAQEAERQSLARELHDEIGQVLTAVRINLQAVQNTHREDGSLPELEESIVIVDEALGRIHELCLELRPSLLDNLGLAAALRWYVDRYRERTGIVAEVVNGFEGRGRLPQELETQCFRIAQEALTNVARHARATRVSIQVKCAAEKLVLTIIDNGIGFDTENLLKAESAASTLGLRGMKERALAMIGRIVIASTPGSGTQIEATFPLRRQKYSR